MVRYSILFFFAVLLGCGADIGDECNSDPECGQGRKCDRASKGGYCTVSPCEPGSCPEDSTCVEFENAEPWCMALCDGNADCRDGYVCDTDYTSTGFCRQEG